MLYVVHMVLLVASQAVSDARHVEGVALNFAAHLNVHLSSR